MNILVTGANGQVGTALRQLAPAHSGLHFHFFDRSSLDISDAAAVTAALEKTGANYVLNCAAYTAVDKAETEFDVAMAINCSGAANLAAASKKAGAGFIHISTDYVFNGEGKEPYKESDPVMPVNAYGLSKQKGEEAVIAANDEAIIIRTSWVYAEHGANFVKTMIRLMGTRPEVGVVADQYGSPTYARDLAAAMLHIVTSGRWVPGIYHFSNDGIISWFDFAKAIHAQVGGNCIVKPLTTAEYPTPARRPAYSVMDKTKIRDTFGIALRPWADSLAECLNILQ